LAKRSDTGSESRLTSRTVSRAQPAALLQLHVVANDEVDETCKDDASQQELDDGNTGKDRRQHCITPHKTRAPLSTCAV